MYPSNPNMSNHGAIPYVDFTIAAGGTQYETDITCQFMNADQTEDNDTFRFEFWMADNQDGSSPADEATSAHADGGSGALLGTLDDDVEGSFLTDATGEAVITVTDTAKSAKYFCVRDPRTGYTNVTRILATADYAAA
jgi:hypothetical protein